VQGPRARRSDDAGSSSQQQQQQEQRHVVAELPFDVEGCCRLQAASLQSLGITSTGEYSLIAVATRAGAGHSKQVDRGRCRAFGACALVPTCVHAQGVQMCACWFCSGSHQLFVAAASLTLCIQGQPFHLGACLFVTQAASATLTMP
jgi:hypothetical protein